MSNLLRNYKRDILKNRIMFNLGQILVTNGIGDKMKYDPDFECFVMSCIEKHKNCDWGCVPPEDAKLNNDALITGDRLLSAYQYDDAEIWIITEWDRSYTTVLFPDEY